MALFFRECCRLSLPLKTSRSNSILRSVVYSNTNLLKNFSINRSIVSKFVVRDACKVNLIKYRNYVNESNNEKPNANVEKLGIVAKFKQMYRDYWYVLVPVHVITSAFWFGGFYYLAKSGVDVIALLKSMGVSEKFTDPLKDSSMGYYALAYALYKIATPVRYTITIGGTTISIKYLQAWGYIKPIPSREKLKEMYNVKKEGLQEMYTDTRLEFKHRKQQIKDRKDHVMSDLAKYKKEMEDVKQNELKEKQ